MDQSANNPPAVFTPIVYYGTMNALAGAASARRPSIVFSLERDAKTPSSYNWSARASSGRSAGARSST